MKKIIKIMTTVFAFILVVTGVTGLTGCTNKKSENIEQQSHRIYSAKYCDVKTESGYTSNVVYSYYAYKPVYSLIDKEANVKLEEINNHTQIFYISKDEMTAESFSERKDISDEVYAYLNSHWELATSASGSVQSLSSIKYNKKCIINVSYTLVKDFSINVNYHDDLVSICYYENNVGWGLNTTLQGDGVLNDMDYHAYKEIVRPSNYIIELVYSY